MKWLDAQHQFKAIAPLVQLKTAQHAVEALADTDQAGPTLYHQVAGTVRTALARLPLEDHAGREQVPQ